MQLAIRHEKMLNVTDHQKKGKLRLQWDAPSHLSEWLSSMNTQQVLARMWREGNTFALLVGMQTGASPVGTSMEGPQNIKNGTVFITDPIFTVWGMYPKKPRSLTQKNICTPTFTAELFIITKIPKQPNCPSVDEWIKKAVIYLHNGIVLVCFKKKKGNLNFCNSMRGPRQHYVEWNKPVRERPYDFTYMWNLMSKIETDSQTQRTDGQRSEGRRTGGWVKRGRG